MLRKDLHEDNRRSWNAAIVAHNSHKADQAAFFQAGGSTLFPEEIELLGNLTGKRALHLQCNAGQDTLSLARLGAEVTGIDISDTAIDFARQLAADTGIPATFHRADVYDWLAEAAARGEQFDVVFSSYGFLCWLSDLTQWTAGIAHVLAPGGRLVLVEFHPFLAVFDDGWQRVSSYFGGGRVEHWDGVGDYVGITGATLAPSGFTEGVQAFQNPYPDHEFIWTIADLITAVLDSGLVLDAFREYPYTNGDRFFQQMRPLPGGRWTVPEGAPDLPMTFGLAARKL